MGSLCSVLLLTASLANDPARKPPREPEGESRPVVEMPLGKFPENKKPAVPPLLKKAYRPGTEVAVAGKFRVANPKTYTPVFVILKFRVKRNNQWVIGNSGAGGKPVKVKNGVYRYRTSIKTPKTPGTYELQVIQKRDVVSTVRVEVDEDI